MPKRFVPHAILVTQRTAPERGQITVAAIIGIENILRLDLDRNLPSATFARQCVRKLPDTVPCFGAVQGFWLNFREDWSVRYDRNGAPCEIREEAVRCGHGYQTFDFDH
jgi:hypothetical protein